MRRNTPKTSLTSHQMRDLLPQVLEKIGRHYSDRPDLILAAWPDVVGKEIAPQTQAVSFLEGVLIVKVRNSTLYSLLSQHDKPRILKNLRERFPRTSIKTIVFRLG